MFWELNKIFTFFCEITQVKRTPTAIKEPILVFKWVMYTLTRYSLWCSKNRSYYVYTKCSTLILLSSFSFSFSHSVFSFLSSCIFLFVWAQWKPLHKFVAIIFGASLVQCLTQTWDCYWWMIPVMGKRVMGVDTFGLGSKLVVLRHTVRQVQWHHGLVTKHIK